MPIVIEPQSVIPVTIVHCYRATPITCTTVLSSTHNCSLLSSFTNNCMIVWLLDLQLLVQSLPNTTKVVGSNLVHGEVYSIQHYVIKVYQWLATGLWFSLGTPVSSTKNWNIVESGVRHHTPNPQLFIAIV